MIPDLTTLLAFTDGSARFLSLIVGVGSLVGGIMLVVAHRRDLDQATAEAETARNERFALRKFRRRSLVGSLIASMGAALAGLYWVTDPRLFSFFVLAILLLLCGIMVIAIVDFFSVGWHSLTDTRGENHRALLDEYHQRKREQEARPLGPGDE